MPISRLHHEFVQAPGAEPTRWAFLLHGIYGAGRNWSAVFRKVVEARPEWGIVPVDLRGHGQSPPLSPPHTLASCVADLDVLARELPDRPRAVIGHSFGGKVALLYADDPEHGVEQCWVVDSTPATGEAKGSAWGMIQVLRRHPGPFPTRDAGVQAVREEGYPLAVARWMGTNLRPTPSGDELEWRLDPDQMEAMLEDFFQVDAWETLEHPHGPEIHVLKATESKVLDPQATLRMESAALNTGRIHIHEIVGGHWLNADNPDALVAHFVEHLA